MANLAAGGVTTLDTWWVPQPGTPGKKWLAKRVMLTLSTMGSATNNIPVSVLGFQKVFRVSALAENSDNAIYLAVPSYDGTLILVKSETAITPVDVSGDFVCIVEGEPTAA